MSLSPVKRAQPAAPPSQRSYFDKFRDHVPPTPASSSRPSPNKDVLAPEPRVVAPCTRIGRNMHPSLAKNRGSGCGVTDPIIVSDTEDKDDISEFSNSLQSSGREQQVSKGQTFRERTVDRSPRRHIREGGHQGGNTSPPSNTSAARPRTESPVKRSYHSGHGLTSSSQAAVPWAAVGVIDQIKGSARRSSKTHTSPSRREKSMIDSVTDAVPIRSDPRRTTVAKDLHSARPPGTSWPGRAPPYRPRQSEPGPSVITTFKNVAVAMHEPRRRGAETAAVYPEAPIDLCSTSGSSTASRISSISIPTPRALSHLSPTKIRSSAFGSHAKKLKPATPVTEVETSPFPLIDIATPLASPISKKNVLLRPSKLETTDDGVPREGVGSSVSTASHESTSQMSGPFASAATAPESATDTQPSSTPRVRQPFPLSVRARELASPSKPSADAMHLQAKIGEAFLVRPSLDALTACPTKVTSTQQHSTVDLDTQYPPRSRLTHAEANLTRRPSRVRPEPGKYTLLPVDTPIHLWTTKDSSHATDKRRLSGKETSAAFARAETETLLAPKVTAMDPSYGVELSAQRSETLTRGPSTRSSTLTSLSTSASPQKVILVMEPMMQDKPEVQVVEEQEEAEEIVEQTPSTESADVLAQFADYDFSAGPDVPPTPSKSTAGEGPVPPRPPRSSTETRHHPLLAHGKPDDLLSPHPRTPSSTSLQAIGTSAKRQGSPLQSLRQKVISPIKPSFASPSKRAASARLVDSLLADANNIRSAFLRDAQQKREERRYRIDAIENEDEPEEDLEDALDSLSLPSNTPPQTSLEPLRRSTRPRAAPHCHQEYPAPQAKQFRPAPPEFDKLVAGERRDRWKGIDGDTAECVLESLRRSSIVQKEGQNPYPTPDSGREASSQVEEDVLLSMDLGKFGSANLDGTLIGGMLADARKSKREGRRSLSRRSAGLVGYQGFWNGSESPTLDECDRIKVELTGHHPRLEVIERATYYGSKISVMSIMLAAGFLEPLIRDFSNFISLANHFLFAALTYTSPTSSATARQELLHLVRTTESHPFLCSGLLLSTINSIWRSLGVRETVVPPLTALDQAIEVLADRQTACELICCLTQSSVEKGWLLSPEARSLASTLLLLAVDSSTSSPLRRSIDETLVTLWPLCLSEATAIAVATDLCAIAESCPQPIKVELLLAVGQRSAEAREITRWMAIGLLVTGALQDLSHDLVHIVPDVALLTKGAEVIYEMLVSDTPDHEDVSDLLTFLCEAVPDVDTLVQNTSEVSELVDFREALRSAANRIHIKLSMSLEGQNKFRLSQLEIAVRMQTEAAVMRWSKMQRQAMRNLAVEEGQGGQTTLSFGRKEVQ